MKRLKWINKHFEGLKNKIPSSVPTSASFILKYGAETLFHFLDALSALRYSSQALMQHRPTQKMFSAIAYLAIADLLPMMLLNSANQELQYCGRLRLGYKTTEDVNPYLLYLCGPTALTTGNVSQTQAQLAQDGLPYNSDLDAYFLFYLLLCIDYLVSAITWRQGILASLRLLLLDSIAPFAFYEAKAVIGAAEPRAQEQNTPCEIAHCNGKRKFKGGLREPLLLLSNDILVLIVHELPYLGPTLANILYTYFIGRYITRMVTPERCERHKAMDSAFTLSLGLSFQANIACIFYLLDNSLGRPPIFYNRLLQHLILIIHIQMATHRQIPVADTTTDLGPNYDPINFYEAFSRFIVDVLFSGLIKQGILLLKKDKNKAPLLSLSTAIKAANHLLDGDVHFIPQWLSKAPKAQSLARIICPKALRSVDDFIHDPIIIRYWPAVQQWILKVLALIEEEKESRLLSVCALTPQGSAMTLYLFLGVPKRLTKFILELNQEEDFWRLVAQLKKWLHLHQIQHKHLIIKTEKGQLSLNGEKPFLEATETNNNLPLIPAKLLNEAARAPAAVLPHELAQEKTTEQLKPLPLNALEIKETALITSASLTATKYGRFFISPKDLKPNQGPAISTQKLK